MDVTREADVQQSQAEIADGTVRVTVHRSSPDRLVFTEAGNTDGWIATDLSVSLER